MRTLILDDDVIRGLYLVRSESESIYALAVGIPPTAEDPGWTSVIRIPGRDTRQRMRWDGCWLPVASVSPVETEPEDRWPCRIQVGTRPLWLTVDNLLTQKWGVPWMLQREVTSIELISYDRLVLLAAERGVDLGSWTPRIDRLLFDDVNRRTRMSVVDDVGVWTILGDGLSVTLDVDNHRVTVHRGDQVLSGQVVGMKCTIPDPPQPGVRSTGVIRVGERLALSILIAGEVTQLEFPVTEIVRTEAE